MRYALGARVSFSYLLFCHSFHEHRTRRDSVVTPGCHPHSSVLRCMKLNRFRAFKRLIVCQQDVRPFRSATTKAVPARTKICLAPFGMLSLTDLKHQSRRSRKHQAQGALKPHWPRHWVRLAAARVSPGSMPAGTSQTSLQLHVL